MSFFKDWFFNKLPNYYHINDSDKDSQGKGLLQRYLETYGEELDDNMLPFIDNFVNIIDPRGQASIGYKYLNHLAYTLGSPPDLFMGDPAQDAKYAKLLNHIVSIYKIKGTARSFELFFALLGYSISVIEYPQNPLVRFDDIYNFDNGYFMDSGCEPCSEFSILSQAILNNGSCGNTTNPVLDPSIYPVMIEALKFLQPINTILKSIITGGLICEDISYCFEEDIEIKVLDVGALDIPTYQFDTTDTFDQATVLSTTTINVTC